MTAAGGPEVMQIQERPDIQPGPGQILVNISASGVNFMDIGIRRGMNNMPLPHVLGVEGVGRIAALGEGVSELTVGQRVSWVFAPGSYADRIVAPASSVVAVPDDIDDLSAVSVMMQGLTASHFATDFYPVQQGDVALVHAAAGGLGQLLTQIIKLRGGSVIGRVSNDSKVSAAKTAGADHVIVDADGKFVDEVMRLTNGRGVDIVYDGSGPATFEGSLASLRRSGTFCWFGPVLGAAQGIDLMSLPNSVKIGYAVFAHHIPTAELLRARTGELFDMLREGKLALPTVTRFSLEDAAMAHQAMESRATTGKLVLIP